MYKRAYIHQSACSVRGCAPKIQQCYANPGFFTHNMPFQTLHTHQEPVFLNHISTLLSSSNKELLHFKASLDKGKQKLKLHVTVVSLF